MNPRPNADHPHEIKVLWVRECVAPASIIDTPAKAADYWHANIPQADWYDPAKEAFVVLILDTRRGILGHNLVSLGSLDTCCVHAREVFRPIIALAGAGGILMHNHPSGNPTPSEADIKVTRDLVRASRLLKLEVHDHVIIGDRFVSMRELGYLSDV